MKRDAGDLGGCVGTRIQQKWIGAWKFPPNGKATSKLQRAGFGAMSNLPASAEYLQVHPGWRVLEERGGN